MRVLIIDDDPIRAIPVMAAGHDVKIAHGYDQVSFYLKHCKLWQPEIICLDNDMPMMTGLDVAREFAEDLFYRPVRIWSRNNVAAPQIKGLLLDKAMELGIDEEELELHVIPFDANTEPTFWAAQGK